MKFAKFVKTVANLGTAGEAIVKFGGKAMDVADRFVHRKEYEKARKRALACKIILGVAAGVLVVLMFPYKIVVEKNGDFEIRTLLLRVFRKTAPYDLPEGGSEEFDIVGIEDDFAECAVIEAVDED